MYVHVYICKIIHNDVNIFIHLFLSFILMYREQCIKMLTRFEFDLFFNFIFDCCTDAEMLLVFACDEVCMID